MDKSRREPGPNLTTVSWSPGALRQSQTLILKTVPHTQTPRLRFIGQDIRTEQGKCNFLLHKWKMVDTPLYECGQIQTIKHVAEVCPLTKYESGTEGLHKGDSEA